MNYRHAFHAGNFADCMKHALLLWLLAAMQKKPAGIFVLDSHAGIGRYDLSGPEATRTGEWHRGIARLANPPLELADYVGLVEELGLYPGSPWLLRARLRAQDRMACCELHQEDHATLRRLFARDAQVSVHLRDAWEAIGALLPPKSEKRALVLIDPPFEAADEFDQLARAICLANLRMPNAVIAAWYPIKHRAPPRFFHQAIKDSGVRDVLVAELWLREPLDASRLNGCGLLVVNPPYGFDAAANGMLAALLAGLGEREAGEGYAVERLTDE
jgi:23S rRNA (adenine2030-N6)-methyltransferase